jgi:hypothetical protein
MGKQSKRLERKVAKWKQEAQLARGWEQSARLSCQWTVSGLQADLATANERIAALEAQSALAELTYRNNQRQWSIDRNALLETIVSVKERIATLEAERDAAQATIDQAHKEHAEFTQRIATLEGLLRRWAPIEGSGPAYICASMQLIADTRAALALAAATETAADALFDDRQFQAQAAAVCADLARRIDGAIMGERWEGAEQ